MEHVEKTFANHPHMPQVKAIASSYTTMGVMHECVLVVGVRSLWACVAHSSFVSWRGGAIDANRIFAASVRHTAGLCADHLAARPWAWKRENVHPRTHD